MVLSFGRFVVLFLVCGLVLFGCTQPPSAAGPSASAALPSAAPAVRATAVASASVAAGSASPTLGTAHIPSVKPSVLPSEPPKPTVAANVPALADFVHTVNLASNHAFNDTRVPYEVSTGVWTLDHTFPEYQYSVTVRPSKTRYWSAFDVVRTVVGQSGVAKNVSLVEGESGPYYKYDLVMKCFDAHYDVQVTVQDFTRVTGGTQYRRTLGPAVMLTLADACPD